MGDHLLLFMLRRRSLFPVDSSCPAIDERATEMSESPPDSEDVNCVMVDSATAISDSMSAAIWAVRTRVLEDTAIAPVPDRADDVSVSLVAVAAIAPAPSAVTDVKCSTAAPDMAASTTSIDPVPLAATLVAVVLAEAETTVLD